MRKPNTFIIGAPKCGTTSIADWLSLHPDVSFSKLKEPHFFNVDGLRSIKEKKEYEKLFDAASEEASVIAEGSTHYIYSAIAINRILEYNPESKFILCLRSPMEMAPALHSERVYQGLEGISEFGRAWRERMDMSGKRDLVYQSETDSARLWYGEHCLLGKYTARLCEVLAEDQYKVVLLEDIRSNPRDEYLNVLKFLNLRDDGRQKFEAKNARKKIKHPTINRLLFAAVHLKKKVGIRRRAGVASKIRELITTRAGTPTVHDHIKQELREYFRQDIHLLETTINRDLSHWLD